MAAKSPDPDAVLRSYYCGSPASAYGYTPTPTSPTSPTPDSPTSLVDPIYMRIHNLGSIILSLPVDHQRLFLPEYIHLETDYECTGYSLDLAKALNALFERVQKVYFACKK